MHNKINPQNVFKFNKFDTPFPVGTHVIFGLFANVSAICLAVSNFFISIYAKIIEIYNNTCSI